MTVAGAAAAGQETGLTKYHYDGLYQLTRAEYPAQPARQPDSWENDAIGNRLRAILSGSIRNYTYYRYPANPNGDSTRLQSNVEASYTYDQNGNVATRGYTPLTWDFANRLVAYGTTLYEYDYRGRRTRAGLSGSQSSFLYDGLNLIGERNTATGIRDDYIFGPGIDEPLAKRDATGNITYYAVDGLGSIVAEVQGGTVTGGVQYGPFGTTTANPRRFAYTGRELDPGGIYYYRARYYHPNIGRFLSEDPSGFEGGINLYAYVFNSPVMMTDPEGLAPKTYNPYKKCLADAIKKCNGTFKWICAKFGGFDGNELKQLTKKCADIAKTTCKVVPDNEVPIAKKKQYNKELAKFKDKCEKNCPPKKFDCDEWLDCIAKQKP